jgi:hypothetical protein
MASKRLCVLVLCQLAVGVVAQRLPDPHETFIGDKNAEYRAAMAGCLDLLTIAGRAEGPMIMSLLKVCKAVEHDRHGKVVCGELYK